MRSRASWRPIVLQELPEGRLVVKPRLERVERPLVPLVAERGDQRLDVLQLVLRHLAIGQDDHLHQPDERRPLILIEIGKLHPVRLPCRRPGAKPVRSWRGAASPLDSTSTQAGSPGGMTARQSSRARPFGDGAEAGRVVVAVGQDQIGGPVRWVGRRSDRDRSPPGQTGPPAGDANSARAASTGPGTATSAPAGTRPASALDRQGDAGSPVVAHEAIGRAITDERALVDVGVASPAAHTTRGR